MKKKILLDFLIITLFMALVVVAIAPSTPILTPINNSVYFNDITLHCSAIDPEGDNMTYAFILNPDGLTTAQNNTGNGSYYYLNSYDVWTSQNTYCKNKGEGWGIAVIKDVTEKNVVKALIDADGAWISLINNSGGNFEDYDWYPDKVSSYRNWAGGSPSGGAFVAMLSDGTWNTNTIGNERDVVCEGFGFFQNSTLQNTTTSNYTTDMAENHNLGEFTWRCQACDNNENCTFSGIQNFVIMNFSSCGSYKTIINPLNIALNISFINESGGNYINGYINSLDFTFNSTDNFNYTFTNTTEKSGNLFCLSPNNKGVSTIMPSTINYGSGGFPVRQIIFNEELIGNSTNNYPLYLLGSADGIYVSFQIVDSANSPLIDVYVNAAKVINGVLVNVGSGYTDAAGIITFWLDPTSAHIITASKTGYSTFQESIVPTQSSYTITLGGGITEYTSNFFGITYITEPDDMILNNNTVYNFTFAINSSYWNLTSYGFNLINSSGSVLNSTIDTTSTGGELILYLDTDNQTEITMNYFWNIGGNYTNMSRTWDVESVYQGELSLKTFFDDLKSFTAAGFNKFGLSILSIIIIVLVVSSLSYVAGIYNPIGVATLVMVLVWGLEYLGIIPTLVDKPYLLSVFVTAIWLGFMIQEISR